MVAGEQILYSNGAHHEKYKGAQISTDLYYLIFQHVKRHDLTVLARVSRNFQLEAEAILYFRINLCTPKRSKDQVISWSSTVASVQRKAQRVNHLSFPSSLTDPSTFNALGSSDEFYAIVSHAFNAIINLEHLSFTRQNYQHSSPQTSYLTKVTFRLKSMAGDTGDFDAKGFWEFLAKQPDIDFWAPNWPLLEASSSFPSDALSRLRKVFLPNVECATFLAGRPIESLVLPLLAHRDSDTKIFAPLRLFANTLHTLVIYMPPRTMGCSPVEMIHRISENAPGLVSLSLWSPGSQSLTLTEETLVEACSRLEKITTLVLNTNMMALYTPDSELDIRDPAHSLETDERWDKNSLNPCTCLRVATSFFTACTRLSQLSFPFTSASATTEVNKDGFLTYYRSPLHHNPVQFGGFYALDTNAWWRDIL